MSLKTGMIASAYLKKNTLPLKIQDHCIWPPEIMTVPLKYMIASAPLKLQNALNRNIFQIHCIYTIHAANALLK